MRDRSLSLALRSSTNLWQSDSLRAITIPDGELETCIEYIRKAEGEINPSILFKQPDLPSKDSPCLVIEKISFRETLEKDVTYSR